MQTSARSFVDTGQGAHLLLAGDASYDDRLLLDGVSADDRVALATLGAIKRLGQSGPTVYLPTHNPLSAARLRDHAVLGAIA